ncbi:E3 ubiquitin-ligase ipaH9.8 domain protein [Shigella flexneri 2930-71]|nr:E3 ubiquitin-ligase ipaH9.8 domain protein [Shigella flexneri 2930-71]
MTSATAEAMVRSREENEFTDWFSLWGPWHSCTEAYGS